MYQSQNVHATGGNAESKVNRTNMQANSHGSVHASAPVQRLQSYSNIANGGTIQRQSAQGGLPSQLRSGIESLSGIAMHDVRVHYNSSKPAQLQAHAYAQGTDIHVAPGQERHLPHEAWHVVQQKQGRVKPTLQLKGIAINDDSALEREADVMGARAMGAGALRQAIQMKSIRQPQSLPIQRAGDGRRAGLYDEESPGYVIKVELPGSGDTYWRTNAADVAESATKVQGESSRFIRRKNLKSTITISGPGGNEESRTKGMSDSGPNSIAKNIENGYLSIRDEIAKVKQKYGNDMPITVLIKAHSRNAVAGTQLATKVKADDKETRVELVAFDPVPGPGHSGADVATNIASLDESTVIYSIHTQYPKFFDPQRVLGAKRVIISSQQHGVGIKKGFKYDGKTYKGSNINALPEGIYWDGNADDENAVRLVKLDRATAMAKITEELSKKSGITDPQKARKTTVKEVAAHFIGPVDDAELV